ncbi:unnamed protein product [Zymoseptoria tritici ST99CH_1E4]|uniref:Uncharacterized protein n=1 Tax=Zymoseptoria tritici ST99CH_1E4 TaxID=1276532 RepID=A0A2H1GCJ7_ZYMTR|nr:unnamed protein product [Zymoseptoria tritici ST99CH_1E4]
MWLLHHADATKDEHPQGLANHIEGGSRASEVRTLSPINASALRSRRAPATNPAVLHHHKSKISSHLGHTKQFLVTSKPPEHTTFDQDVQNVTEHGMRGGSGERLRPAERMKLWRAPLPEQNDRENSLAHDFDAVAATNYVPQQQLTQIAQTQAQRRHNALERERLDEEDCAASIAAIKAAEIAADERRLARAKDARDAVQQSLDKALAQQLKRKRNDLHTIGKRQQQAVGGAAGSEKPRGFAVPATDFKSPFQEVQGQSPASEQPDSANEFTPAPPTHVHANSQPRHRGRRAGVKQREREAFQDWARRQGLPPGTTNEERLAMNDRIWDTSCQLFFLAWRRRVALLSLFAAYQDLHYSSSNNSNAQANLNRLTAEHQQWDGLFAAKFEAWRRWRPAPGA